MPGPNDTKPEVIAATPAVAEDTTSGSDDFDAIFDSITSDTPTEPKTDDKTTEIDAAAAASKTEAGDAESTSESTADGAGAGPETGAVDSSAAPAEGTPAEKEPTLEELKAEIARMKAERAAPAVEEEPEATAPTKEAPKEEPKEEPEPELYTTDEKALIAEHRKEWGDVARAEELIRRSEYNRLARYIFKQVHDAYAPVLERALHTSEQVAEDNTVGVIRRAHNDYDDGMHEAVVKWAGELPGFRRKAAQGVIESGEPQDVIDLITEYKQATGKGKPKVVVATTAAPSTPVVKTPAAPLTDKAKKAAEAMTARDTKRTGVGNDGPDSSDFDGAWEEATAAAK